MCTSTYTLHPPPPSMAVEVPCVAAAVLSDPESVLTSNVAGSRKRLRGGENLQPVLTSNPLVEMRSAGSPSTSGRPTILQSILLHQDAEIVALINLQMEKLRSGVEEARKRQCRGIAVAVEQRVGQVLEEKRLELDALQRRNAELEERVRQIAAEGMMWFRLARNSEALVAGLRASLEQALLRGGGGAGKEGSGESDDDAQSCCYEEEGRPPTGPVAGHVCRACGEGEACVLLLPCRHVCVCEACAERTAACPVCGRTKNRSLRIFLS